MAEVQIEQSRDNAILLLAAAEELDLDASVVRSSNGGFVVSEEVAKKAGLSKEARKVDESGDVVEDEPVKPAKKTTAKKAAAKKSASKE